MLKVRDREEDQAQALLSRSSFMHVMDMDRHLSQKLWRPRGGL